MKRLLQSKRFKRNLQKWLCMYVGAVLLLTSVVTYSKYITSLGVVDGARVTRFRVKITSDNCTDKGVCDTDNYSQVSDIPYKFKIDTSELEVRTFLSVSIDVDPDFLILSVKENDGIEIYNSEPSFTECNDDSSCNYKISDYRAYKFKDISKSLNRIRLDRIVEASDNSIREYTITVKYNKNEYLNVAGNLTKKKIVKIGYSAIQDKERSEP